MVTNGQRYKVHDYFMENKRQKKIIFTGYALRIPLFPLRAMSTTAITTAAGMVFAQFVSFLLQSLNQEMMIDGE